MQLFLPINTRLHLLENLIKYGVSRFNANCMSSPCFRCTLIYFTLWVTHGLNINNALTWSTAYYMLSFVYLENVFRLLFHCHNCPNFSFNLRTLGYLFFPVAMRPNAGNRLLILQVPRSSNDASQSVGLLWTGDQLIADTSTWQHLTLTTSIHPSPGGIPSHKPSRQANAGLNVRY